MSQRRSDPQPERVAKWGYVLLWFKFNIFHGQGNYANRGKRTNSLTFAQSDCYTCASLGERCDRRRPRCSTGLGVARRCVGFATPLSWDSERMVTSPTSTAVHSTSVAWPDSSKQFGFVRGAIGSKKHRNKEDSQPKVLDAPSAATAGALLRVSGQDFGKSDEYQICNSLAGLATHALFTEAPKRLFLEDFAPFGSEFPNIFTIPSTNIEAEVTLAAGLMDTPFTSDTLMNLDPRSAQEFALPGPPRLETGPGLALIICVDHEELLGLYESEYCVLPITGDISLSINPLRCERQVSKPSGLLIQAIIALCCQHSARLMGSHSDEAAEHRRKATQLLESAFKCRPVLSLLDPILILFTLHCTISASGIWLSKLRTHSMLQTLGGTTVLTTPRMRAQVGMLIWWHATLALISRKSPINDQTYLNYLVRWEKQDEWSFFDLTRCPRDLLVHLVQLAELARQNEIASTMKWLTFNMAPVTQIEHELSQGRSTDADSSLNNHSIGSHFTEQEAMKQVHGQQDRYHCAEAWRQALLLYIEIILKSNGREKRSIRIHQLLRKIIDRVRCCRRTSPIQKQLLIPVFLAGSEISVECMREFVKEYCSYWAERSRYNLSNSVALLFDEIWASGTWWGAVIDSKTSFSSDHDEHRTMQPLFR
ncbi:hypothetical protein BJY01DRAFT_233302 [Aspergillus pseudoustus]|uniref:Fungal-specific transcription factor domain-containing protein n=1 Tax=Aspergillus pseudoustus TaxID=1810923 RepID=A0ABR4KG86_9EURO